MFKQNIVQVIFFGFLLISCNTSNAPGVRIDADIRVVFRNEQGDNLLNPGHQNAITEQNTDLYFLENGEKRKVYEGNLDCPKMFCIHEGNDNIPYEYFMHLFTNTIKNQNTAITYIEFNDATKDTIEVAYDYNGNSVYLTKVWYNQELRWNTNSSEDNPLRYIVVTRN